MLGVGGEVGHEAEIKRVDLSQCVIGGVEGFVEVLEVGGHLEEVGREVDGAFGGGIGVAGIFVGAPKLFEDRGLFSGEGDGCAAEVLIAAMEVGEFSEGVELMGESAEFGDVSDGGAHDEKCGGVGIEGSGSDVLG